VAKNKPLNRTEQAIYCKVEKQRKDDLRAGLFLVPMVEILSYNLLSALTEEQHKELDRLRDIPELDNSGFVCNNVDDLMEGQAAIDVSNAGCHETNPGSPRNHVHRVLDVTTRPLSGPAGAEIPLGSSRTNRGEPELDREALGV
jgi:hypothetical protein